MSGETHLFPVTVDWQGGKLTRATTDGGLRLDVATPPVFPGGLPGYWSPEDLVAAASASCLVVTLVSACKARELPLHDLQIRTIGEVGARDDGRYGFRRLEAEVRASTVSARTQQLAELVARVERGCIVSTALGIPLDLAVDVRAHAA